MNSAGLMPPEVCAQKLINIISKNNNDLSGKFINLNEETIYEIWHGEKMQEARMLHAEHKADQLAPCRVCYRSHTRQVGNVQVK